eukprot:6936848-Prymnesium_polylepis.1
MVTTAWRRRRWRDGGGGLSEGGCAVDGAVGRADGVTVGGVVGRWGGGAVGGAVVGAVWRCWWR